MDDHGLILNSLGKLERNVEFVWVHIQVLIPELKITSYLRQISDRGRFVYIEKLNQAR
jgi:hypothetical protein